MREIKFRAWHREQKVMVFDKEDGSEDYLDGIVSSFVGLVNAWLQGIKDNATGKPLYEWMQYTGLKDKNGKEIYEGDIVNDQFDCGQLRRIYYSDHYACFRAECIYTKIIKYENDGPNENTNLSVSVETTTLGKIIGNIYENPELFLQERE